MSVNGIGEGGVTLLELIIGVAMITTSVVVLSLIFPKASANITINRQRALANSLADSAVQEIKQKPYNNIDVTPALATYFPYSGGTVFTGAGGCDCSQANLAALPTDASYTEDGMTYTRVVCINLVDRPVGSPWLSYCLEPPPNMGNDKGLKNIRVRVSWVIGPQTYFTETESQVAQ